MAVRGTASRGGRSPKAPVHKHGAARASRGQGAGLYRAYPVETHTHYMLGVHSNGRRRRTLDVVGVGDNRIGTEPTLVVLYGLT